MINRQLPRGGLQAYVNHIEEDVDVRGDVNQALVVFAGKKPYREAKVNFLAFLGNVEGA